MALLDFLKRRKKKEDLPAGKEEDMTRPDDARARPQRGLEERGFSERASRILQKPQVSEKAESGAPRGVHVFRVSPDANKIEIKRALTELYGVKVRKVNLATVPSKIRFSRGRPGRRGGYKKAIVFLAKGAELRKI